MSVSQSKMTPSATQQALAWSLEVVRGRLVGREHALEPGETVVGNALNGARGLDLADQEGNSPRKMAGSHAALTLTGQELTIRDLESPGGTFVNHQRLLAGQARRLVAGDIIQLGGVQIRVKQAAAQPAGVPVTVPPKPTMPAGNAPAALAPKQASSVAPATARASATMPAASEVHSVATPASPASAAASTPGRLGTPFVLAGGAQCRSWDDFLVLAAQKWPALRVELTSGRLAEFLRRIHRPDLVPLAGSTRSADDQLDDWLARIPATVASSPELDVHPETLQVRVASGGGITQQKLRVTNVGYRVLRWSASVDPPATTWLRLRPEHDGKPVQTIDQADLPLELELPETIDRPLIAQVVIESNGGTRRVGVRVERPTEPIVADAGDAAFSLPVIRSGRVSQFVAGMRPGTRVAIGCAIAVALRALALAANALPLGLASASFTEPRLISLAVLFAVAGVIAGLALASWRGDVRVYPAAALAGGQLGLLAAAVWFAVLRSVEPVLGSWASSIWAVGIASAALGGVLALISLWAVPYRSRELEVAP